MNQHFLHVQSCQIKFINTISAYEITIIILQYLSNQTRPTSFVGRHNVLNVTLARTWNVQVGVLRRTPALFWSNRLAVNNPVWKQEAAH